MKKSLFILLLLAVAVIPAGAQKPGTKENKPEEQIKVEREYDEQGNLIRFDSLRIYNWSTDSAFRFSPDEGWEKFFGKDFPFSFLEGDELFRNFGNFEKDSSQFRNFFFHNDSSFFLGPNSSFFLPPGFFLPDPKELDELQKHFDYFFGSPVPDDIPGFGNQEKQFRIFTDPDQQKEWEELLEKQEQEMKNFREKWENKKKNPGIEKM